MLIKIHAQGLTASQEIKAHIDAKVRLMLGLYIDKIRRVDVFLSDINGPKGGEDISCKMKVVAFGKSSIIVQETAGNLKEAINVCAHRVKRSAGRRFDRALSQRRVYSHGGSALRAEPLAYEDE